MNLNGQPAGLVDAGGTGVTVDGLTLAGGGGTTGNDAAPVVSEGGNMALTNCTITGNHMTSSEDDVAGGVLSEGGPVSITNCTITNNSGSSSSATPAGGVLSEGGSVTISGIHHHRQHGQHQRR